MQRLRKAYQRINALWRPRRSHPAGLHWMHWVARSSKRREAARFLSSTHPPAPIEPHGAGQPQAFTSPIPEGDNTPSETGLANANSRPDSPTPILMARGQRKEPTALLPCSSAWRPWAGQTALPDRHVEISAGSLSSWSASSIGLKERR